MRGALAAARRAFLYALRLDYFDYGGMCLGDVFRPPPSRGARAWVLTFRRTICRGENLIEYSCGACGAHMVQNVRVGHMLLLCVFLIFFERGRSVWFTFCILVCLRA